MITKEQINKKELIAASKNIWESYYFTASIVKNNSVLSGVDTSNEKVKSSPKGNMEFNKATNLVHAKQEIEEIIPNDLKELEPKHAKLLKFVYSHSKKPSPIKAANYMNISTSEYYNLLNDSLLEFGLISSLVDTASFIE